MYVDIEIRTSEGRIDIVIRPSIRLYIIVVKKKSSNASSAISKITDKAYFKRFALHNLPKVLAGITFDCTKHTIADWETKDCS